MELQNVVVITLEHLKYPLKNIDFKLMFGR